MDCVSVIIPVYNTPYQTFERCLQSVRGQTYPHVEIIVVDDGSTEELSQAYERSMQSDPHHHFIRQPNAGVSAARNEGLRHVSGRWVAFIDADDRVEPKFLSNAVALCQRHDLDIVTGGMRFVQPNSVEEYVHPADVQTVETDKLLMALLTNRSLSTEGLQTKVLGFTLAKLYRTATIEGLTFPVDIHMREDMLFNLEAFRRAHKIGCSRQIWYEYILADTSASISFRSDYTREVAVYLTHCWDFIENAFPQGKDGFTACALYAYMTWLKISVLHPQAPYSLLEKRRLIRASFSDKTWLSAIQKGGAVGMSRPYRCLASLYHARCAWGIWGLYSLYRVRKALKGGRSV